MSPAPTLSYFKLVLSHVVLLHYVSRTALPLRTKLKSLIDFGNYNWDTDSW